MQVQMCMNNINITSLYYQKIPFDSVEPQDPHMANHPKIVHIHPKVTTPLEPVTWSQTQINKHFRKK